MKMTGAKLISVLKKKFRIKTYRNLAKKLGITEGTLQNWKNRPVIHESHIAGLIHTAYKAGEKNMQATALRPVVEFFPIKKEKSKGGKWYELFAVSDKDGEKDQYLEGLQQELKAHKGVYIFFDSRGHAIYVGKTRQQSLWKEMKFAFNKSRKEVQTIKRVKHPTQKREYLSSKEKARQIIDYIVPLHELAAYFSAYEVSDIWIEEIEAMLVRGFANDLLNQRMERFGQQKKAGKKRK